MQEESYRRAVRSYMENDAFVRDVGIRIMETGEEQSSAYADVLPQHLNGNGCVQGGMLYALADFAFALHANYLHPYTVTQGGSIDYLRPAYCKRIIATAKETARSGRNSVSDVVITDENGTVLCVCRFNGFIKETDREAFLCTHGGQAAE